MKDLLVTSALPYANGPIHIGHLVEYIQTDIFVRYCKLSGRHTIYVCADDTHGTPIMLRARDEGITPEQLIARVSEEHQQDFASFDIEFDNYYSTHSEENKRLSELVYERLKKNGYILEKSIEQAYCDICTMFLPDRYIRGICPKCSAADQYGDSCEVCSATYTSHELVAPCCATCRSTPKWKTSQHVFFHLGAFTSKLDDWIKSGHVQVEVANKLQEWFQSGLQDWDISRDAPYFGFEIPGSPGKYFYVWLDAPIGYMASTMNWCQRNGADFDAYWRGDNTEVYHFIGKDIIYFHALFWPAMLMGADFRTPTRLCVHGFLTVNGEKMSKSRGTFVTARTYIDFLDPQYLRYYYATKLTSHVEDIDLNLDDFVSRVNSDLVNKLANIPSRTLALLHKNCNGSLGSLDSEGYALIARLRARCEEVGDLYERREFSQVTRVLADMAGEINSYLQEQQPWELVHKDTSGAASVCTAALNAFKILAILIQPILPQFSNSVAQMLNIAPLTWFDLDNVVENKPVGHYQRLVDRVDSKKIDEMIKVSQGSLERAKGTV